MKSRCKNKELSDITTHSFDSEVDQRKSAGSHSWNWTNSVGGRT